MSQQFSLSDSSEEDPASGASGTPLDPRAARDANAYSPYSSPMFLPAALPGYEMPDRSVPLPRFLQAKTTAMASATEAPAAGMKPEVQEDRRFGCHLLMRVGASELVMLAKSLAH